MPRSYSFCFNWLSKIWDHGNSDSGRMWLAFSQISFYLRWWNFSLLLKFTQLTGVSSTSYFWWRKMFLHCFALIAADIIEPSSFFVLPWFAGPLFVIFATFPLFFIGTSAQMCLESSLTLLINLIRDTELFSGVSYTYVNILCRLL